MKKYFHFKIYLVFKLSIIDIIRSSADRHIFIVCIAHTFNKQQKQPVTSI